jgi:hypothetical protein
LPDLPREARGFGVRSLGERGMGDIWRAAQKGATANRTALTDC